MWWRALAAGHINSSDHHYSNICSEVVHDHHCLTVHMAIAPDVVTLMSQVQVMSGSHSVVQLTRTTVL